MAKKQESCVCTSLELRPSEGQDPVDQKGVVDALGLVIAPTTTTLNPVWGHESGASGQAPLGRVSAALALSWAMELVACGAVKSLVSPESHPFLRNCCFRGQVFEVGSFRKLICMACNFREGSLDPQETTCGVIWEPSPH